MSFDIQDTLSKVIKPELIKHYDDWEKYANDNEKKGLKLIAAIYKHKGLKKFRAEAPSKQFTSFNTSEQIDLKKAEEIYRKSQVSSYYQSEFGGDQKAKPSSNNILRYQKCSEMDFKYCLAPLAVQFLDNWIDLKDELDYCELVLLTLRSLYARYKSIQISKSETNNQYQWNVDWKLAKPIRVDKIGADLRSVKVDYSKMFDKKFQDDDINRTEEGTVDFDPDQKVPE